MFVYLLRQGLTRPPGWPGTLWSQTHRESTWLCLPKCWDAKPKSMCNHAHLYYKTSVFFLKQSCYYGPSWLSAHGPTYLRGVNVFCIFLSCSLQEAEQVHLHATVKTFLTTGPNEGVGINAEPEHILSMHRALGSISSKVHTRTKPKSLYNAIPTHVKAFLGHILRSHNTTQETWQLRASNSQMNLSLQIRIHSYLQFTIRYTDKPRDFSSDSSLTQ